MQPGSIVVYRPDPLLYDKMVVIEVTQDMHLVCEMIRVDRDGNYPRELFAATELELADKWAAAVA